MLNENKSKLCTQITAFTNSHNYFSRQTNCYSDNCNEYNENLPKSRFFYGDHNEENNP